MANDRMQSRLIVDEAYYSLPEFMTLFHGYPYQRVGFDLFVLDHVPQNRHDQYELVNQYHLLIYVLENLDAYEEQGLLDRQLDEIEKVYGVELDRMDRPTLHRQLRLTADRWAAGMEREDSGYLIDIRDIVVPASFEAFGGFENGLRTDWFGEGVEVPFENTTVRVPDKAFEVLEKNYGPGWMRPVKFVSMHTYPCYKNQEAELRRLLDESGISLPIDDFCRNWHMINGGE